MDSQEIEIKDLLVCEVCGKVIGDYPHSPMMLSTQPILLKALKELYPTPDLTDMRGSSK